jgi:hypothetical protein
MACSKKDFVAVAKILLENHRLAYGPDQKRIVHLIALEMAEHFSASNPNFNRERFMSACGMGEVK